MKQEYVKIQVVAKEYAVSVSTIRKWLREGKIPRDTYIKAGRTYRFDVAALTEALRGRPPLEGEGSDKGYVTKQMLLDITEKLEKENSSGIAALDDFDEDY